MNTAWMPPKLNSALRSIKAVRILYGCYQILRLRMAVCVHCVSDFIGYRAGKDGLPLPSPLTRYRVHGSTDRESYLRVGRTVGENIQAILKSQGKSLFDFGKVLDFGCGCGRVTSQFRARPANCELHGTDIDPRAIAWCQRHLGFASWNVNGFMPPVGFAEDTFDLIYAISVFTHLDENYQFAWLQELKKILKPGGMILLTIHGESTFGELTPEERRLAADGRGFCYKVRRTGRLKLDGLPDFYQSAYHSKRYIAGQWSKYFKILLHVEKGINNHQDAILMVK